MPARPVARLLAAPAALLGLMTAGARPADEPPPAPQPPAAVWAFKVNDIDGKEVELSKYKGDVLLIVNTASQCGYTPQYEGLEALYQQLAPRGFQILAFPANEFGRQEPGTDAEIKAFCTGTYDVSFPLFAKVVVKGPGIHPLFDYLTRQPTQPEGPGDVPWNFAKFLVDRQGKVIARFAPGDDPKSDKVVKAIEAALAAPK